MVSPFLPDAEKLAAVREALPATAAGIYLDTPVAGPLPAETARAMSDVADWELRVGRGGPDVADDTSQRLDEARAAVGAVVGADFERVTIGPALPAALAMLAVGAAAPVRLVTVDAEHSPATRGLAALLATRGVACVTIDADLAPTALEGAVEDAISGDGALVVLPHVSAATGAVLPIRGIADLAHARGATLVVDGSQAAGAIPVDVDELAADAYLVPSDTWLLGPAGLTAIAVSSASSIDIRPALEVLGRSATSRTAIVGLARSCGWSTMYVGLGWQQARTLELARRTVVALAAIDGVEVLTPPDRHAGIVSFRIEGWTADAALGELGARVFAIASIVPERAAIRIGLGFFNTETELGRFVEAVAELAAHTPESLPPRRRLTIVGGE